MEFKSIFTAQKELTKEEFLRQVLIGLTEDDASPADIMEAKFGEVNEFTEELLQVITNCTVNYSGSVGYDRQEQYVDKMGSYKTVHAGERYIQDGVEKIAQVDGQVYVDVVKTRTVTDWRPHSGTYNAQESMAVLNKDVDDSAMTSLLIGAIKSSKQESISKSGSSTVNAAAYKEALAECIAKAEFGVSWPGDHVKDKSFSTTHDEPETICFIVPCYVVEFEYKGKKFTAKGAAIGKANELHETPEAAEDVNTVDKIADKYCAQIAEAEKPLIFHRIGIGSAIGGFLLGVIGLFALPSLAGKVMSGVFLPLFGIGLFAAIFFKILVNKKTDAIRTVWQKEEDEFKHAKRLKLVAKLEELGLDATGIDLGLDDDDDDYLDEDDEDEDEDLDEDE